MAVRRVRGPASARCMARLGEGLRGGGWGGATWPAVSVSLKQLAGIRVLLFYSRVSIFHEFCSSFRTEIARELLLPFCLPSWLRGCPAALGRGVPRGTVPPCWAAPAPTLVLLPGAGG